MGFVTIENVTEAMRVGEIHTVSRGNAYYEKGTGPVAEPCRVFKAEVLSFHSLPESPD